MPPVHVQLALLVVKAIIPKKEFDLQWSKLERGSAALPYVAAEEVQPKPRAPPGASPGHVKDQRCQPPSVLLLMLFLYDDATAAMALVSTLCRDLSSCCSSCCMCKQIL